MSNSSNKSSLFAIALSILIPYTTALILTQLIGLLIISLIHICCILTLIYFTIRFLAHEKSKWKKSIVFFISLGAIVLFFSLRRQLFEARYFIYVKINEKTLDEIVTEIKKQKTIYEMSSGERHQIYLNDYRVVYSKTEVDTTSKKYFIDEILKKEGIDKKIYNDFRGYLRSLNLLTFEVMSDSSIVFIMDGYLGDVYGIKYFKEKENQPHPNILDKKISGNWYIY